METQIGVYKYNVIPVNFHGIQSYEFYILKHKENTEWKIVVFDEVPSRSTAIQLCEELIHQYQTNDAIGNPV